MKTFYIQQKITAFANQYKVFEGDEADGEGNLIAFVQQKRLAFREKFSIYTDESKNQIMLEIQARKVLDLGARYDVRDASGKTLGVIGKVFGASLLKSTWQIFQPDREDTPYLVVSERSTALALIRRAWEILPVIGDIPFFVKYHFDFTNSETGKVEASYDKVATFYDHYRLSVEDEAALDSKVFIAMGIMLDALQSR